MITRRRHPRPCPAPRSGGIVAAAVLAGIALVIGTPPASPGVSAAPTQTAEPLRLELVDPALAFVVGDVLRLDYLVTGDQDLLVLRDRYPIQTVVEFVQRL